MAALRLDKPVCETSQFKPIHRDFYHDQILLGKEADYLVDLDLYSMGDPALDIGNFVAHIMEAALRTAGTLNAFDETAESFVETYLDRCGEPMMDRIETYTRISLARHIWISTQIPSRRHLTESILTACEELLASRGKQNHILA